jgi:hypothetical protein
MLAKFLQLLAREAAPVDFERPVLAARRPAPHRPN